MNSILLVINFVLDKKFSFHEWKQRQKEGTKKEQLFLPPPQHLRITNLFHHNDLILSTLTLHKSSFFIYSCRLFIQESRLVPIIVGVFCLPKAQFLHCSVITKLSKLSIL